jgi:hypothetical protein
MDMDFNPGEALLWRTVRRDPRTAARPDWQGLRARMAAARQARQSMALLNGAGEPGVPGSFDSTSARLIVGMGIASGIVNQTDSANRNAGGAKDTDVAVTGRSGDRGQP